MAPFTVPFRRSGPPPYYRHHHYDCGDFPRTQRLMAFALFFSFSFFFIVFIFIFHFNKSAGVVLLLLVHNLHSSSSMQHAIMMMMMFEEWKVRSSVGRGLLYFRSGEKYLDVNPHDIRRCAGTPCIVKNWQLRRDSRASSSFLVVFFGLVRWRDNGFITWLRNIRRGLCYLPLTFSPRLLVVGPFFELNSPTG